MSHVSCVSQGTSVCQVTLIGLTVIFLYASRACYNLVVLALTDIQTINSFDYDWYNVSDQVGGARLSRSRVHADVEPLLSVLPQADLRSSLGDAGYVVFGVILFVWELLPTSLVVFFFRVRRPAQERVSAASQEHSSSADPSLSVICCFQSGSAIPSHVFSNRPYFFDNPRRYDSDDDLAWPSHPVTSSTR